MPLPSSHDAPPVELIAAVDNLSDPAAVAAWVEKQLAFDAKSGSPFFLTYTNHTVGDDGRVSLAGNVNAQALPQRLKPYNRLPVNFKIVSGAVWTNPDIISFEGFPEVVDFINVSSSAIPSWNGCPRRVSALVLNEQLAQRVDPKHAAGSAAETINLGYLEKPTCLPRLAFFPQLQSLAFTCAPEILDEKQVEELKDFFIPRLKVALRNRAGVLRLEQELIDAGYEEWV
jgi:hypothetical protein